MIILSCDLWPLVWLPVMVYNKLTSLHIHAPLKDSVLLVNINLMKLNYTVVNLTYFELPLVLIISLISIFSVVFLKERTLARLPNILLFPKVIQLMVIKRKQLLSSTSKLRGYEYLICGGTSKGALHAILLGLRPRQGIPRFLELGIRGLRPWLHLSTGVDRVECDADEVHCGCQ